MSGRDSPYSSTIHDESSPRSKFTFRDLRHLSQASVSSPLRVIALIDFDAFYAQCETVRLGLPSTTALAVQQFDYIIALNYAGKDAGLKRGMLAVDAKLKCPEVVLQHVATWREGEIGWSYRSDMTKHTNNDKAALDPYRLESRKAFNLVKSILPPAPAQKVEKASVDEIFLDLSVQVHNNLLAEFPDLLMTNDNDLDSHMPMPYNSLVKWHTTHVFGEDTGTIDWDDIALGFGSAIVQGIRDAIFAKLHYTTSAGVARNKVLAKLAAGHNKPNQQTVIRTGGAHDFLIKYKFTKIRGLGGKAGSKVKEAFKTEEVAELLAFPLKEMKARLGVDLASWVYAIIRGDDYSEVVDRIKIQSMLSVKTFTPPIDGIDQAHQWLRIFIDDLLGRMAELDSESGIRRPRTMAVSHFINGRFGPTRSKQKAISPGSALTSENLFALARSLLADILREGPGFPCVSLSMNLSDFEEGIKENRSITSFLDAESSVRKRRKIESESPVNKPGAGMTSRFTDDETRPFTKDEQSSGYGPHATKTSGPKEHTIAAYLCPNCNTEVPASEVLEHLDWHVAMDLQNTSSSQA